MKCSPLGGGGGGGRSTISSVHGACGEQLFGLHSLLWIGTV